MFGRLFRWGGTRAYARGIEAYNEGRLGDSLACFEEVLRRHADPRHPDVTLASFYRGEAHRRLAADALEKDDARLALEHLEAALEDHPGYPDLHLRRGLSLLQLDDPLAAEAAARQALECNEDFVEAGLLLVLSLRGQGSNARAEEERRSWAARAAARGHALAPLLAGPEIPPSSLREHLLQAHRRRERGALADTYLRRGLYREARHVLQALVEETPAYPDLRVRLATAELALGEEERARPHVQAALRANPEFDEARLLESLLCVVRLDLSAAEEGFTALLSRERVARSARFARAIVHLLGGELGRAWEDLRVLESENDDAWELLELRAALETMGSSPERAREPLLELLEVDPRPQRALDLVALAQHLDDPDLARRARPLLDLSGRGVVEMLARAELLRLEGESDAALDLLERVMAEAPDHPGLLFAIARLRTGRQEFAAAARRLARIQALGPQGAEVRRLQAHALRRDGQTAAAMEVMDSAGEDAWPESEEALETLYLLRAAGRGGQAAEMHARRAALLPLDLRWRMQATPRWWGMLLPGSVGREAVVAESPTPGTSTAREPATPQRG